MLIKTATFDNRDTSKSDFVQILAFNGMVTGN